METALNGFDEFWSVYPRRVAKLAALKAYGRALKLTTPERIVDSAMRYARDCAGKDVAYIKHPSTWLNGGCWGDYETDLTRVSGSKAQPTNGSLVYVNFADRDAWDIYGRSIGKSYPRDRNGGWWFPSLRPPVAEGASV